MLLATTAFADSVHAADDELPPGLEQALQNPAIPMIVDATILKFNKQGHTQIKVNAVYKSSHNGKGEKVKPPAKVRGHVSIGKVNLFTPLEHRNGSGKDTLSLFPRRQPVALHLQQPV